MNLAIELSCVVLDKNPNDLTNVKHNTFIEMRFCLYL